MCVCVCSAYGGHCSPLAMSVCECAFSSFASFSLSLSPRLQLTPGQEYRTTLLLSLLILLFLLLPPPPGRTSEQPAYSLHSLCLQLATIVSSGIIWLLLAYCTSRGLCFFFCLFFTLFCIFVGSHCFLKASIVALVSFGSYYLILASADFWQAQFFFYILICIHLKKQGS